jgi:hypothetical protein
MTKHVKNKSRLRRVLAAVLLTSAKRKHHGGR